jgi:trk system potassium uptake protein TrkH
VTPVVARMRRRLGVDLAGSVNLIGALLKYVSLAFALPVGVALWYSEPPWPFLIAAGITAGVGGGLELVSRGKERIGAREGYLVVAMLWLLVAGAFALPYVLADEQQLSRPLDAYFEAMSGASTTGASVLVDVEALNHSLVMWRQFTAWVGGLGVIVLALAVLQRLRIGGRHLLQTEAPGPELDSLAETVRATARQFVVLYVALTVAQILVLSVFGWTGIDDRMSFFEAAAQSFSTVATAGFSTQARSLEPFAAATQWAVVVFMILAGTNFALMYRALVRRTLRPFHRDEEFRVYVFFILAGSAILFVELVSENIFGGADAVRHAVFNAVSMMTTTGFATADFNQWTSLTALTLVGLMFVSASAGSTSGSIKVVRHVVIAKVLRRELQQTLHPELVMPLRVNSRVIDERAVRGVIAFALLYLGTFAAGALALLLDAARVDGSVSPFEAIAASATAIGNVGPGFGFAGPMGSFAPFSDVSTGVMIVLMWLGRIEIIPAIVLFTRSYWRA